MCCEADEQGRATATEPVEPRAGTKGNAGQQNARRAQDRESAPNALNRIRRVARERKKEKFTSLFHHISVELLEEAFYELQQNAAPGVDGLTWQEYETGLERNLEDLHARLHRGRIGHCRRGAYTYPSRTGGSAPSRSPL